MGLELVDERAERAERVERGERVERVERAERAERVLGSVDKESNMQQES